MKKLPPFLIILPIYTEDDIDDNVDTDEDDNDFGDDYDGEVYDDNDDLDYCEDDFNSAQAQCTTESMLCMVLLLKCERENMVW